MRPYLTLNAKDNIATTALTIQFATKDETILSNELTVQVVFRFKDQLPITQDGDDSVKIQNYENLLAIFGIAVGTFRGILYEWLKGSQLQRPLPYIDIEDFIKQLMVSFSK